MIKRIIEEKESSSNKQNNRENKRNKMTPEQKQKQKSKHATNEQTRWTKRRKNMTPEELKNENSRRATKSKEKKLRIEKQKENNPKGFVSNDADLLSKKFVEQESASNVVSDAKYRDEKGCHYLGKMSVLCGHCSGLEFESEGQGHFIDSNGTKHSHFGELCCNKGKLKAF